MPFRPESITYPSKWERHLKIHEHLGPQFHKLLAGFVSAVSPAITSDAICSGRCHLKAQSSNCSTAAFKDRNGEEGTVGLHTGFESSLASMHQQLLQLSKPQFQELSPLLQGIIRDHSDDQNTPRGREIFRHILFKLAFIKILVTFCMTLQVHADSYTEMLSLSCSSLSLRVPVMWIQSFSWTLKNRQLWNKNTSASSGWSDRNINYTWMHNNTIFRKWENHLGMKKMFFFFFFVILWNCSVWTQTTSQWWCWCKWTETMFTCSEAIVCIGVMGSWVCHRPQWEGDFDQLSNCLIQSNWTNCLSYLWNLNSGLEPNCGLILLPREAAPG